MTKTVQRTSYPTGLFLLLLIALCSCKGQGEPNQPPSPPVKEETERQDFDPYFKESIASASGSKYGPTSITRNIIQDRNGDIWLATWEGIIRYDGTTFTNVTNKDNLRKFHVFSSLEDRDGNLWFGTIGAGIYRYDGTSFTNITEEDGLANDKQGCFLQDRSGKIWIGTMGGISVYDGTSYRNINAKDGLPNNDINSILEDRSGKIWIASRGALSTYDGLLFTSVRKDENQSAPDASAESAGTFDNVRRIIEDRQGNIWFGGNDGLWRYDTNGKQTQFAKEFTGYIYEDRKGNIWTSSAAPGKPDEWRLSRYAAAALETNAAAPTVMLQRKDMFFGITEDTNGGIWLGTLNGVGRYDGKVFNWFRAE